MKIELIANNNHVRVFRVTERSEQRLAFRFPNKTAFVTTKGEPTFPSMTPMAVNASEKFNAQFMKKGTTPFIMKLVKDNDPTTLKDTREILSAINPKSYNIKSNLLQKVLEHTTKFVETSKEVSA